jgi:hypothetical protein
VLGPRTDESREPRRGLYGPSEIVGVAADMLLRVAGWDLNLLLGRGLFGVAAVLSLTVAALAAAQGALPAS